MALDATFPLIAYTADYTLSLDVTLNGVTQTVTLTASDKHVYGTAANDVAASGTMLADFASGIDSAFAGDFAGISSAVTWLHGAGRSSLLWRLDVDLGEAATSGDIAADVGDTRIVGVYSTAGITASAAGDVLTFTSEFSPHGVFAPCMPNELQTQDREYVQRTERNPRDLSQFSRIQHATNVRRSVNFRDVSGFYRDSFRRGLSSYQKQAGFGSFDLAPNVGTLETMFDAWANGDGLKLYTGTATAYDVDPDLADTFRLSDIATPSSAGGTRFDIAIDFVDV